jgi:dipeptidyl aminopeptidase/acylaminoacyl peptidase
MNIDGTGLTSLGSWSPRVSEWSPDGTRIAFERYLGQLYVINSDGSGAKRIPTGASVFAPTWSPDGTRIAYTTFGSQLRIIGADGTNDHLVPNLPSGYIENADWGEISQ